jgi:hypothetical protein
LTNAALTGHVFRKTVATVLREADLLSGAVADQLGNTRAVAENTTSLAAPPTTPAKASRRRSRESAPFLHPTTLKPTHKQKPQADDLG